MTLQHIQNKLHIFFFNVVKFQVVSHDNEIFQS